jgi:hypothetical protein
VEDADELDEDFLQVEDADEIDEDFEQQPLENGNGNLNADPVVINFLFDIRSSLIFKDPF